jgi:hypothetical protein
MTRLQLGRRVAAAAIAVLTYGGAAGSPLVRVVK